MKIRFIIVLIIAFGLGFLGRWLWGQYHLAPHHHLSTQTASFDASSIQSMQLQAENQRLVTVFDKNDPRIRILYFGFTRCPDVCPTSLAMLAGALNQIDKTQLEQLRPIFISIDPERDDADSANQYARYFHANIEGLSGSLKTIQQLANYFGVIMHKSPLKDSKLDYTVDHNSYFYFVNPNGSLINKVPHTLSPAPIIHQINTLTIH